MTCQQAVIFDLDDTLFVEMDFVESGLRAVAVWLGKQFDLSSDAISLEFIELQRAGSERVFNRWLDSHSVNASVEELLTVYRNHIPAIQTIKPVVPILESLRPSYRLGLVSDGYLKTQQNKWSVLGLQSYFQAVVFSDEFGREHWKPSSVPFQRALQLLNVDATNAVYVGDNPTKDFVGARNVGMKSIRFRHKRGVYAQLEPKDCEHQPDAEVGQLSKLETAIRELLPCGKP